jgi:SET domain-containing protein
MVFVSPKICVKPSPVHRWGVFAVDFIAEGEVIEESPMVELEKSWIEKDDKILSKYRFNFPSGGAPESQQVCLGYGSLYNHSDNPGNNNVWGNVTRTGEINNTIT